MHEAISCQQNDFRIATILRSLPVQVVGFGSCKPSQRNASARIDPTQEHGRQLDVPSWWLVPPTGSSIYKSCLHLSRSSQATAIGTGFVRRTGRCPDLDRTRRRACISRLAGAEGMPSDDRIVPTVACNQRDVAAAAKSPTGYSRATSQRPRNQTSKQYLQSRSNCWPFFPTFRTESNRCLAMLDQAGPIRVAASATFGLRSVALAIDSGNGRYRLQLTYSSRGSKWN